MNYKSINKRKMKHKGFLKLYRSILSKPEMTELVSEQGAFGFGMYMMIMLYLSQCDDYEGMFTNGQLQAFTAQAKTSRRKVRYIIEHYGLFEVNGNRFKIATKSEESHNKVATKSPHSPARKNRYAREEIEIDKEKENKEKSQACVSLNDTQPEVNNSPIGPSAYESVDSDGKRHGSHGELVPWWAPPQTDVYRAWSILREGWVPLSKYDTQAETDGRNEMQPEDFMMKTAWEKLDESEQYRIQDYAKRK